MKLPLAKIAIAACLAVPLAACSSMFGSRTLARHSAVTSEAPAPQANALAEAAPAPVAAAAVPATDEGRAHLAGGRYGLAIDSFRTALANGEPKAPALNGFGIAYANIGRFDLAQRFFLEAIEADPGDDRYAANLGRLMRSPTMAFRHDGDVGAAVLRTALAANTVANPAPAPEAAAPQRGRLARVSSHEVHIATAAPMAAPQRASGARGAPGFQALVRFELPRSAGGVNRTAIPGFRPLMRMQMPAAAPAAGAIVSGSFRR